MQDTITMPVEVTIGWTRSDLEYSSFDGYEPGRSQHTIPMTLQVPVPDGVLDLEDLERISLAICEAAFEASNNPFASGPLVTQIGEAIAATGYCGKEAHYSLSVGDTVTVGEVMYACEPVGWRRVTAVG